MRCAKNAQVINLNNKLMLPETKMPAKYIAGEFVGRLAFTKALPAIALTTDTSILTAIGNDYGYTNYFQGKSRLRI